MSGYDIFAWVVLVILLAVFVLVVWLMGSTPGHVARRRGHPWAEAVAVRGGLSKKRTRKIGRRLDHADLRLRIVADRDDLGLCRRAGEASRGAQAMMALYLALLLTLVWLGFICFNAFWNASPLIVLLPNIGLFIPMGWGAPQGNALVYRNAVSIVPDVAGEVVDVPVVPNAPVREGDVLFRIDPTPFDAQANAIEAQLKLSSTRLSQMTSLYERDAGRGFDVEQRQSEVDQLKAQLANAQWNLDKTVVHAPADGYVTNVALRKGARVGNLSVSPVMAFIDTSATHVVVEIDQINARYVAAGQQVEIAFKFLPGRIFTGKVESILQAVTTGQAQVSGQAVMPKGIETVRLSSVSRSTTPTLRKRFRQVQRARPPSSPTTSRSVVSFVASCCGRSPFSTTSIHSEVSYGSRRARP